MNIKQYGLEVRRDNIALKFFQVQGVKIVTDLNPSKATSSSSWRKADWESASSREGHRHSFLRAGIKQEKVTSHHPGRASLRSRDPQCWTWGAAAQQRVSQELPQRGNRKAQPHRKSGKEQQLQAELNWPQAMVWLEDPGEAGQSGPLMLIRYFHRWSLR